MKQRFYVTAFIILAAVAAGGGAYATSAARNDATAISSARIDLSQAIQAAEQHVGGKASKAEYEKHKGQWMFDVEVVKGMTVMDVKVDPTSGKVIAAVEDRADHDDGRDRD